MKNRIFYIYLVAFGPFLCFGQTGKFYGGISALKEFDVMNLNQPMALQAVARLWPVYLQAEYKYDNPRVTPFQVTQSTESYGGRFGIFLNNKKSSDLSGIALHAGILNRNEYKKIIFTREEYPLDALGNPVETDKIQVLTSATTYVFGITILQVFLDDGKKLQALLDDYDIKLLQKKKRFHTLYFTLEGMFQPQVTYENSVKYNPYNFYIDREIYFQPQFKKRPFGVNLRMDYAGPLHVGLFLQMGVFPGITHKSDDYLDFNFACRVGALINFGFFSKNHE